MFLVSLALENFRAYPEAELDLGVRGVVIVTGANNAGKTALLAALDMVGGLTIEAPLRFAGAPKPAVVRARFEFSDSERQALAARLELPARDQAAAEYMGALYTLTEVEDPYQRLAITEVEILGAGGQRTPVARITPTSPGNGSYTSVDWPTWLASWPDKPSLPGSSQSSGNVLRNLEGDHGPLTLTRALIEWKTGYYHFRALRTGATNRVSTTDFSRHLDPTGANLINHLSWLKGNIEDAWERIRTTMQELIPDIGRLQVRGEASQAEVGFETAATGFVNVKDAGTGVEQLLLTIVVGQTSAASMLVVEEPETNLHPGAQRQLMAHLDEWSNSRPVIVATHSPLIIDSQPGGAIYEVTRSSGRSAVARVHEDQEVTALLKSLGVRSSDVLGSNRILVVEGKTDQAILEEWFPSLRSRNSVAVVPGGGGGGVWQIHLMEAVSSRANRLPRPMMYLRDRDELGDRDLDRLAHMPVVRILARREIENYLLDVTALAAELTERSGKAVSESEIANELKQVADGFRDRVVLGRVLENAPCLQRLRPVEAEERRQLLKAPDLVVALLELVRPKLQGRIGDLEQCLRDQFEVQSQLVVARWVPDWADLVPGADVLVAVFQRHGLGYSKEIDGAAIARRMGAAPAELVEILGTFLGQ